MTEQHFNQGNTMSKFKINDIVQTNLEYVNGFDDCSPPPKLKRKTDLRILKVSKKIYPSEMIRGGFLYTVISKSGKEFQILECFLEVQE